MDRSLLFPIQLKFVAYNVGIFSMLYTMSWNIVCTHKIIPDVFSVGFLVYNVAHNIYNVVEWYKAKACS